jgi:hypothetical protein
MEQVIATVTEITKVDSEQSVQLEQIRELNALEMCAVGGGQASFSLI